MSRPSTKTRDNTSRVRPKSRQRGCSLFHHAMSSSLICPSFSHNLNNVTHKPPCYMQTSPSIPLYSQPSNPLDSTQHHLPQCPPPSPYPPPPIS